MLQFQLLPPACATVKKAACHIPVPAAQRKHQHRTQTAPAAVGRRAVLGGLCCCSGCACSHRNQWYDRYFAFNMAVGMEEYEEAILPVKQQLFTQLLQPLQQVHTQGSSSSSAPFSLLEVGIGTGPNLPFYAAPEAAGNTSSSSSAPLVSVTGLEPNTAMWSYTHQAAAAAGLPQQQLQLVDGDAQQMPFADSSFDAAVMTLVLCSVPQPAAVLNELLRVLKPGGQLLLIEHVISPSLGFLQLQQRLLNPLQRLLADNCHLTRDTAAAVLATSFVPQPLPELTLTTAGVATAGGADTTGSGRVYSSSSRSSSSNSPVRRGSGNTSLGSAGGRGGLWRFDVEGMGLIAPHVAGILQKPL